jgi:hypothetical protein
MALATGKQVDDEAIPQVASFVSAMRAFALRQIADLAPPGA